MNKQSGFGLPEIMISLLLASFVMMALMNHYLSIKQHYMRLQSSMDDAMELQLVADLMRDSIQQAGFTPCLSVERLVTVDQREGHGSLSAIDVGTALTIHRMSLEFNVMLNRLNSTQLLLTKNQSIRNDHPLIIADCFHAEVQRVLEVNTTPEGQIVILENPLAFTYQEPVYVGEWVQERFFIRAPGGLFYQRHHTDELTPLVKTWSLKREANYVQVNLGVSENKTLKIEARVRAW